MSQIIPSYTDFASSSPLIFGFAGPKGVYGLPGSPGQPGSRGNKGKPGSPGLVHLPELPGKERSFSLPAPPLVEGVSAL